MTEGQHTRKLDRQPEFIGWSWHDWQERAECRKPGVDSRIFFPEHNSQERGNLNRHGGFTRTERRAKATCISCPVRRECLELMYSFGRNQEGVWGGALGRERRRHRGIAGVEERITALLDEMDEQAIRNGWKGAAA